MPRWTRVALALAIIVVGNSAYLWADGVVKALFVIGVAPAGILVASWPSLRRRGAGDSGRGWQGQWPPGGGSG